MRTQLSIAARELADEALGGRCATYGIALGSAKDWGDREGRVVPLAPGMHARLAHDNRGAPFAIGNDRLLVSLSDEGDLIACAWGIPAGCEVLGIGIDLVSTTDLGGERGQMLERALLSEHERELTRRHFGSLAQGIAFAFAAKEASFKALAAPLRTWYESHEEELAFEVREFELADIRHERGTLRRGGAQRAMDALGIGGIELYYRSLPDLMLAVAVSLREARQPKKGVP